MLYTLGLVASLVIGVVIGFVVSEDTEAMMRRDGVARAGYHCERIVADDVRQVP